MPTAIEELLRFDTPLSLFERWVLDAGRGRRRRARARRGGRDAVRVGEPRRPAPSSEPDDLDLARDPNPYLSFGAGIHYCLGAPLAKLELGDRLRDAAAARAAARAGRGAALEADVRPARARVAPRPDLSGRCATSRSATRTRSAPRSRRPTAGRTGWSRRSDRDEPRLELVANLGVNGYTSADLIRDELPALGAPAARVRQRPDRRQRRRPGRPARDVRGERRADPRHAPRPPARRTAS